MYLDSVLHVLAIGRMARRWTLAMIISVTDDPVGRGKRTLPADQLPQPYAGKRVWKGRPFLSRTDNRFPVKAPNCDHWRGYFTIIYRGIRYRGSLGLKGQILCKMAIDIIEWSIYILDYESPACNTVKATYSPHRKRNYKKIY